MSPRISVSVPITDDALPNCTDTETLCKKKLVSLVQRWTGPPGHWAFPRWAGRIWAARAGLSWNSKSKKRSNEFNFQLMSKKEKGHQLFCRVKVKKLVMNFQLMSKKKVISYFGGRKFFLSRAGWTLPVHPWIQLKKG